MGAAGGGRRCRGRPRAPREAAGTAGGKGRPRDAAGTAGGKGRPREAAGAAGGGKIQPFMRAVREQRRGKSASSIISHTGRYKSMYSPVLPAPSRVAQELWPSEVRLLVLRPTPPPLRSFCGGTRSSCAISNAAIRSSCAAIGPQPKVYGPQAAQEVLH